MAIPDLVERLSDADAAVRGTAIRALANLNAKGIISQIVLGLEDVDDSVREQALAALPRLEAASSPELIRTLENLLKHPNPRVSARAAVVLMYLGETDKGRSFFSQLVQDDAKRLVALEAYHAIALVSKSPITFDIHLILEALSDPRA